MWCDHCNDNCTAVRDLDTASYCCDRCGKILQEDFFSDAPTFVKTSSGESRLTGSIQRLASEYSASRERTLNKGRDEISYIVDALGMSGGDSIINPAYNLYKIAVERNFTKGRNTSQIAAACLYIACRQHVPLLPYLLIDFSNHLQINVYVLGSVFLQLCKLLSLEEHPIVQKPIDPSLFMGRFTQRLLGENNRQVTKTALNIIASMKRDWMQTGRKPSGLCGAALYISVHAHELTYSKSAIVDVVHVCEATLTKRLIEFENTESGSLTIEELDEMASKEVPESKMPNNGCDKSVIKELLCQHKGGSQDHYAHGLCKECYDDFIEISGGLQGTSEPPAFQRAEMQRKEKAEIGKEGTESIECATPCEPESNYIYDPLHFSRSRPSTDGVPPTSEEPESYAGGHGTKTEPDRRKSYEREDETVEGDDGSGLSDIDDSEVDGYLHTEEEKHFKKKIWEAMNKDYLEEQAAKEAAAAVAKEAYNVNYYGDDDDEILAAQKLAAATAEAVAKSRKEKKQKRAEEARKSGPARTAAEATAQILKRKTYSSKINYELLNSLYRSFDDGKIDDGKIDDVKKQRTESPVDDIYGKQDDDTNEDYEFSSKVPEADDNDEYENDGAAENEIYDDDEYVAGNYHEEFDEDYNYADDFDDDF